MGTTGIILSHQQAGFARRVLLPLIVTLSLIASQLALVGVAPAAAADTPWSINGVIPDTTPTMTQLSDPCNTTDDKPRNGANYKLETIQNQPAPVFNLGNVTGKGDLCNVWLDLHANDSGVFLYFAWQRFQATGAADVHLELQRSSLQPVCAGDSVDFFNAGGCNPFANRAVGDLLLTFNFEPSPVIQLRTWGGNAWGAPQSLDPAVATAALDNNAQNSAFRGEAEINLTTAGVLPSGDECVTFATALPFSQTANSISAELQDIVLNGFPGPTISNCGNIEITKVTSPPDLAGDFDISLLDGDTEVASGTLGHGDSFTYGTGDGEVLLAGDGYRIEEVVPEGWSDDFDVTCTIGDDSAIDEDGNITVEVAQTTRCTVTNYADDAEITVTKVVTDTQIEGVSVAGDDLADPDDFDLNISGIGTVDSGSTTDVTPGQSYTISETQVDGYTLTDLTCDGATVAEDGETASVTPAPGEQISCTFTNEPIAPTLTLVKILDNAFDDTVDASDFDLSIDDTVVEQGEPVALPAGTYTISEDGPDGLRGYDLTHLECTNGQEAEEGEVTLDVDLSLGEDVTCTFTNAEIPPVITLVKELGDTFGGDLAPEDFTLTLNTVPVALTADGDAASSDPQTITAKLPVVAETVPDGYTLDSLTCVAENGTVRAELTEAQLEAGLTSVEVPVVLGDEVTCTFVNSEIQPTVTLVKELGETFGGELTADEFDLELNGEVEDQGVAHGVDAGENTVSEDVPDGYALASITCLDAEGVEVASTDDATSLDLDVALGDEITCTFVNDEIEPTITLVKEISTDLNGPIAAEDFELQLNDLVEDQGVAHGVDAGENTVSEVEPDGYTLESITCLDAEDNEVGSTTDATSLDLDVALGDEITCTFVNAEIPASLTLVKVVDPAFGGGLGPEAFTLRIDDEAVVQGEAELLPAGTVTIDEVMPDGAEDDYELTSIVCVDAADPEETLTSTTDEASLDVDLELGQVVTCTFTNAEIQPALTLLKELGDDFGGEFAPEDVELRIDGEAVEVYGEKQMLGVGTYTIDEVVPDGYTFAGIVCDDGQSADVNELEVTLGLGDDVTCTFTNDQIQPQLTLVKELGASAGGTMDAEDFVLLIDGEPIAEQGVAIGLDVDEYELSEVLPDGYRLDGIKCDDEAGSSSEVNGLTIALDLGDDVTCTFSNSEIPPTLTLVKVVDGGPLDVDDFTLLLDGEPVDSGEVNVLDANTPYTIGEEAVASYVLSDVTCTDLATEELVDAPVTLALGQDVECVLTNTFVDVDLSKTVVADEADDLVEGQVVRIDDGNPVLLVDGTGGGVEVTYEFTVTNTGNGTLYNLVLDDPRLGGVVPLEVDVLEPGASTTVTATYPVSAEDVAAGTIPNVATVSATGTPDGGTPVGAEDDATVDVVEVLAIVSGLDIVKEALVEVGDDGLKVVEADEDGNATVTYRFTITNLGNSTIDDLSLLDDKIGEIALPATSLAAGESLVVEADYAVTADDLDDGFVTNVGTVTGVDELGNTLSAVDDERVELVQVLAEIEVQETVERLPRTGADSWMLLALASLMSAMGAAVLLFTPKRRRAA